MLLFMASMQTFLGLVVWVVLSEIFPMTIRGFAMGVATFALWTANTIISFVFPTMAEALGSTGTFAIFAVINAAAWLFTYKFAPETRGRALEELEDDFRTHDAAHFVHQAPAGVHGS
jgi:MFS transporter, SP family, major inositol transporter